MKTNNLLFQQSIMKFIPVLWTFNKLWYSFLMYDILNSSNHNLIFNYNIINNELQDYAYLSVVFVLSGYDKAEIKSTIIKARKICLAIIYNEVMILKTQKI